MRRDVVMYSKSKNVLEFVDRKSSCKIKVTKKDNTTSYSISFFTPWSGIDNIPDNADKIVREAMERIKSCAKAKAPQAIADAVLYSIESTIKDIDQAEPKGSYILNCGIERAVAKGRQPKEKKSKETPSLIERVISFLRGIYGGNNIPPLSIQ